MDCLLASSGRPAMLEDDGGKPSSPNIGGESNATAIVPLYVQMHGCFGLSSIRREWPEVAGPKSPLRERVVRARLPRVLVGRATAVRVARYTKATSLESKCCRRTSRN